MTSVVGHVEFPEYSGTRCLMMPYVQGDPESCPAWLSHYARIIEAQVIARGAVGFLTIDESMVTPGKPHRGARAKFGRALHTEVGRLPGPMYCWGGSSGGGSWGGSSRVTLDADTVILLANSIDRSCAVWPDAEHRETSDDGDIGDCADQYPYSSGVLMRAGDVHRIGVFTPHESLPIASAVPRQFLRIVGSGVHGREPYFTTNPVFGGWRG
jgi:hypothetical protein